MPSREDRKRLHLASSIFSRMDCLSALASSTFLARSLPYCRRPTFTVGNRSEAMMPLLELPTMRSTFASKLQ